MISSSPPPPPPPPPLPRSIFFLFFLVCVRTDKDTKQDSLATAKEAKEPQPIVFTRPLAEPDQDRYLSERIRHLREKDRELSGPSSRPTEQTLQPDLTETTGSSSLLQSKCNSCVHGFLNVRYQYFFLSVI